MPRGIIPRNLGEATTLGAVPFIRRIQTSSGTSTYQLFPTGAPFPVRVLNMEGVMTAAGAGGMTVALQNNAGSAITNTISLAALQDQDTFDAAKINDANWDILKGQNLKIVTDGTAQARIAVWLEKV